MVKRLFLFVLLCFIVDQTCYGQSWYIQKIGEVASIEFPYAPKYRNNDTTAQYAASGDSVIYNVNFKKVPDDIKIEDPESIDKLYESVFSGTMQLSKGKLLGRKEVVIENLKCLEFNISTTELPKGYDMISYRIIYHRSTLIIVSFLTYLRLEHKSLPLRLYFFDSFKPVFSDDAASWGKNYILYITIFSLIILLATFFLRARLRSTNGA